MDDERLPCPADDDVPFPTRAGRGAGWGLLLAVTLLACAYVLG